MCQVHTITGVIAHVPSFVCSLALVVQNKDKLIAMQSERLKHFIENIIYFEQILYTKKMESSSSSTNQRCKKIGITRIIV